MTQTSNKSVIHDWVQRQLHLVNDCPIIVYNTVHAQRWMERRKKKEKKHHQINSN